MRGTLLLLSVALLAMADTRGQSAQPLQGLVVSPSGEPVASASVTLFGDPDAAPDCVRAWLPRPPPLHARTDDRGHYRLESSRRGTLLVKTDSGLGALVADASPGVPDRVQLQPLAEVDCGAGTERVVATTAGDGLARVVGSWTARVIQLPRGRYSLLVSRSGTWEEHNCNLRGAHSVRLTPSREQLRLRLSDALDARIAAASSPHEILHRGSALTISAESPPRVLRIAVPGDGHTTHTTHWVVPGAASQTVQLGAAPTRSLTVEMQAPAARALVRVFVAVDTARGPALRGSSQVHADGTAPYARVQHGRVILWALGRAAQIIDVPALARNEPIELLPGSGLQVTVGSPGSELGGVRVVLQHSADPWLRYTTMTDRRGHAEFSDLPPGEVTVHVDSPDRLAMRSVLSLPRQDGTLELHPPTGARLEGLVQFDDGKPAAGASVQLRDTKTADAPMRSATADVHGKFAFSGLPADRHFTLSAEFQSDGRTWSAQQRGVQPEQGEWRLQLRLEDPPQPGERRR